MPSTPSLLRVWYGNTTTPPTAKVEGSMYVVTGVGGTNAANVKYAALYFDVGNDRYVLKGGGQLDHTFTVGGVGFDGSDDASVNLKTYGFATGNGNNGTFQVTEYTNGAATGTTTTVAIKGLGSAAYQNSSAFLGANAIAVEAAKLSCGLSIYNNSDTAITFGTDGDDKSVYIGSDLVIGNSSATAMTTANLTNNNVYLIPLVQTGASAWSVKRRIQIKGTTGITVTAAKTTGAITITGPTNITGNAGTADLAKSTQGTLTLKIKGTQEATFNGADDTTFDVTYAKLGEIPVQYVPAAALERLYVTTLTSTNNTDAKAIAAVLALTPAVVQAGDVIQVNAGSGVTPAVSGDGSGKMYFLYEDSGLKYKEFNAGRAVYATEAGKTSSGLTIVAKGAQSSNANGNVIGSDLSASFDGSDSITFTIPLATSTYSGLLSHGTQTIGGDKTFTGSITGTSASFSGTVSANQFSGQATSAIHANAAGQVDSALTLGNSNAANDYITYDGSDTKAVYKFTGATASAAGKWGFVPTPAKGDQNKLLGANCAWVAITGGTGTETGIKVTRSGNTITIAHNQATITARDNYTNISTDDLTSRPFASGNAQTFTIQSVKYDKLGHITGETTTTLTLPKITCTVDATSNDAIAEGYELVTFNDGANDIVIHGGVIWETFS